MRNRRLKWLASAGLALALVGYAIGRRHQHDTVETCMALAGSLDQMVTMYEAANTEMWKALGVVARVEEGRAAGVVALPVADATQ